MSSTPTEITPQLYEYLVEHSLKESTLASQLRQETLTLPGGSMMAAPEQSHFIALLIRLMQANRIIEVGTFTGYTTLVMAEVLPQGGKIITCDISEEAPQVGLRYWQQAGVSEKIELVIRSGLNVLEELQLQGESNSFDLAFIDADKSNNRSYLEKALTLVRPGGVIIVDNVLWKGRVLENTKMLSDRQTAFIKQFNDEVFQDPSLRVSIIPLGDGMSLIYKESL